MMTTKIQSNYECCMCGDLGLSHELFRCKVCHFRSQHRYCSNLYPKAESYRVCNWCLIQKNDDDHETVPPMTATTSYKKVSSYGPRGSSASPKMSKPTSPFKKPNRPSEGVSPSGRKRITAQAQTQAQQEEKLIRRTKSEEISNGNNNVSRKSPNSGAPAVIKHVFRNKVRRYKLLDEVSS